MSIASSLRSAGRNPHLKGRLPYREMVYERDPAAHMETIADPVHGIRFVVCLDRPPARCEAASKIGAWKAAWLRIKGVDQ